MTKHPALRYISYIVLVFGLSGCSDGSHSKRNQATPPPPDPYASASSLAAGIQSGDIKPSELLDIYLERIDTLNRSLNAVVSIDIDAALARAAEADAAQESGEFWGPLHGLPITIKDTINVAGFPTVVGDPALTNYIPKENAAVVQRVIDAGAIVVGKTNTPLYAGDWKTFNDVFGTTNNPWDLSRTPGGSSGGPAAAISAGMTALEVGDDLAGSPRAPAHFSGVYSHMPTFGLLPMDGHFSQFLPPPAVDALLASRDQIITNVAAFFEKYDVLLLPPRARCGFPA